MTSSTRTRTRLKKSKTTIWGRELFKVKCSNKDKCVMLPETGAYFIKQQAAAVWNSRSDNA